MSNYLRVCALSLVTGTCNFGCGNLKDRFEGRPAKIKNNVADPDLRLFDKTNHREEDVTMAAR